MKKNILKVGNFLLKWVLTPILALIGFVPVLLGVFCGAVWTAFKAGWNLVEKI